jgi:uncharacterized protein (TIGR02145 family)
MSHTNLLFLLLILTILAFSSCEKSTATFTDSRDQVIYKTQEINGLTWMLDNLQFETDSSWCHQNDSKNCEKYGRLYTWEDAMSACPDGWRLPTQAEWMDLSLHFAKEEWHKKDGGENRLFNRVKPGGETGFDLQLAGMYDPSTNYFFPIGAIGSYWSSTKFAFHAAICAVMEGKNGEVFMLNPGTRTVAHSCRCVQ